MNKNLAPKIIQAFDETQKVSGASDHQNGLEPVVLSCRSWCKAIKTLQGGSRQRLGARTLRLPASGHPRSEKQSGEPAPLG